ncbi:MAG: hypothetical protein IJU75_01675 [Clostridia bacterium]|nr:hypothetical protein [Clostridia bacterium]
MNRYGGIPDEVLKSSAGADTGGEKPHGPGIPGAPPGKTGTKQRGPFKKKRAGVELTREEVAEIKEGRRELRRRMKAGKIYTKKDFELVASSEGLYFDKRSGGLLLWFWTHWLGLLVGALIALLLIIFIFSTVTRLRGYYTVSLSEELLKEGFTLCENPSFTNPTVELIAPAADDVTCISIRSLPEYLDRIDGSHNGQYFAYTYYIRNEGKSPAGLRWDLNLSSETKNLSDAVWVALYVDGDLRIYAEKDNKTGESEALPPKGDDTRGYRALPISSGFRENGQFEVVKTVGEIDYLRVIPDVYASGRSVTGGTFENVQPGDIHKYTVVLWVEGDDPDADNSKIGGNLGMEMSFRLIEEEESENGFAQKWKKFWGAGA